MLIWTAWTHGSCQAVSPTAYTTSLQCSIFWSG